MREALHLRRITALVVIALAVTAFLGTYIHDSPLGITPIADINSGRVGVGENVTIKGRILSIFMYFIGIND